MPSQYKTPKIKITASQWYAIVGVSLMLFVIGALALLLVHANLLTTHLKENMRVTVILADNTSAEITAQLRKQLQNMKAVRRVGYISKDQAAKKLIAANGDDFVEVLGYNPLFASLNLKLQANYANEDSLEQLQQVINETAAVVEVFYPKAMLQMLENNWQRLSVVLVTMSLLFLIIAFVLIDNTIRLSMFAQRFSIKSMQLVGATRDFVMQPFIKRSIINGLLSALIALILLVMLLLLLQFYLPELKNLYEPLVMLLFCCGLIAIGVGVSWWSTQRAVFKYLATELDDLY